MKSMKRKHAKKKHEQTEYTNSKPQKSFALRTEHSCTPHPMPKNHFPSILNQSRAISRTLANANWLQQLPRHAPMYKHLRYDQPFRLIPFHFPTPKRRCMQMFRSRFPLSSLRTMVSYYHAAKQRYEYNRYGRSSMALCWFRKNMFDS